MNKMEHLFEGRSGSDDASLAEIIQEMGLIAFKIMGRIDVLPEEKKITTEMSYVRDRAVEIAALAMFCKKELQGR